MTYDPPGGPPAQPPGYPPPGGWPPYGYQSSARPEPPSSVRTAVTLMYAGAVIAGLALLLTFVRTDSIREQAREQLRASDQPVSDQLLDQAVTIGVAVGVVLGLVAVGLWILMAVMNRKGKKWARIVASVLGGLNIAFTLFGFVAGSALGAPVDAVSLVQSLISLGLAVAILALLWQRRSSAYYDAMSRTNTAFG